MNGKRITLGIAAGAVAVLAIVGAGGALAEGPGPGPGNGDGVTIAQGRGPHGGQGQGVYHEQVHTAAAEALGMTVDELQAEIDAGKTLVQVADERGIDTQTVRDAMAGARPAPANAANRMEGRGHRFAGNGAAHGPGAGDCPNAPK